MKTFIFLLVLVGIALLVNACVTTCVRTQPVYSQTVIPVRPSMNHTWINGNWVWNNRNRSYTQGNGYWAVPKRGRSYTQGYWQTNHRGHRWVRGRWR